MISELREPLASSPLESTCSEGDGAVFGLTHDPDSFRLQKRLAKQTAQRPHDGWNGIFVAVALLPDGCVAIILR